MFGAPAVQMGADGWVDTYSNLWPDLTVALYNAARAGDLQARLPFQRRFADGPSAVPSRQVEVDMIVVERVRTGRQHGGEVLAGAQEYLAQEFLLARIAAPATLHDDFATIGEAERENVGGIAEGMLGNIAA